MMFELHSCGYITPLVGDFVAAGMDILQPLQTNNDLRYIKDNYGKDLILRLAIFDKQMDALGMTEAVSYTHLDVYKRQVLSSLYIICIDLLLDMVQYWT